MPDIPSSEASVLLPTFSVILGSSLDTLVGPLLEGYHESRRCSKDTYPESYITKYTSIRRLDQDSVQLLQYKQHLHVFNKDLR